MPASLTMDPTTTTAPEPPIQSPHHHLKHMDRDSAVALAVLLILILTAIAYYTRSHVKVKRQIDLEKQQAAERRASLRGSVASYTWYKGDDTINENNIPSSISKKDTIFKIKGVKCSGSSSSGGSGSGSTLFSLPNHPENRGRTISRAERKDRKPRRHWFSSSKEKSQDEHSWPQSIHNHPDYMFGTCTHNPPHPIPASSRSPSPCSHSQSQYKSYTHNHNHPSPQPRDQTPRHYSANHPHSHHPSLSSHPPSPTPTHNNNYIPPLTPTQATRTWWREVARHGSTTAASARLSTLETIPEPEMAFYTPHNPPPPPSWALGGRSSSSSSSLVGGRSRQSSGSRLYDWTRPGSVVRRDEGGDGEGDGDGAREVMDGYVAGGFGSVGWDVQSVRTFRDSRSEACDPKACEAVGGESARVQRTDWAAKTEQGGL
ncbi:hypothetical protein T440DRAFT_545839 [Plenodomus tracheiphilus IPT5]|uniref:Uncharacterized protein n=1 Tax=Plenodomus tracheiphilus IPT5 TaxID=1408161 RepID=A0A6A7BE58_9PLEO|nr:hypothetical protein T440DRAFT_545839 [Plenodomus tracheiphilus IPT5]